MASPSGDRSWSTFTVGVAVASSAFTLVSVLGYQRIHRRRRRNELEDDIHAAMRRAKQGNPESNIQTNQYDEASKDVKDETPRYLASLAAAQEGKNLSTPLTQGRPSNANAHTSSYKPINGQPRFPIRPSISASSSSSNVVPRKSTANQSFEYDESLIREQLSRNYSFLGEEAMQKLRGSFVIVVGAGGVGSWCALMLLRSGVGRLRLIDFDQVSLSSLNRHACANLPDVGRPKVQVCKDHFAQIAPWCEVDARVEIFRKGDADRLLGPAKSNPSRKLSEMQPTYIVDCIDNLDTKVDLLAYCYDKKIPCFSSMGAGAKADPSQIQVGDLNTTAEDPLARRVRRGLRSRGIWGGGVMANKKKNEKKEKSEKGLQSEKGTNGKDGLKSLQDQRKKNQEAALKKLEAGKNETTSVKKLEHSGRGADEAQNVQKRFSMQSPAISRRASSNSSVGSGAYFSPLSSPEEEVEENDLNKQDDATIRISSFEEKGVKSSVDKQTNDNSEQEERDATKSSKSLSRPSLATLSNPKEPSNSSVRTTSLKELAAEDMQSAFSGRTSSFVGSQSNVGEEEKEDSSANEEQACEKPYTIMCVYTNEKSDTRLLPLDEEEFQKGKVDELAALEDFRVRILPVLGPLPAMFGLAAATYILCDISGRQLETLPFKSRRKTAERLWHELENTERKYPSPGSKYSVEEMALGPRRIPWTAEDIAYIYEEVYRCRSVVPPHETLTLGRILRWDSTLPLSYSNVALFSREDGLKHEREVLKNGHSPVEVWGEEATVMFKRRMADERRMNILR